MLWALDFSLDAARRGVAGLNFHGGLGPCQSAGTLTSPWYSPLCTGAGGRLRARPEYYALTLLHMLEGCAFVRSTARTRAEVSVYALRCPDGALRVVIDDMQIPGAGGVGRVHGRSPGALSVTLRLPPAYAHGSVIRLGAPGVFATDGVTLGGAALGADGRLPP